MLKFLDTEPNRIFFLPKFTEFSKFGYRTEPNFFFYLIIPNFLSLANEPNRRNSVEIGQFYRSLPNFNKKNFWRASHASNRKLSLKIVIKGKLRLKIVIKGKLSLKIVIKGKLRLKFLPRRY